MRNQLNFMLLTLSLTVGNSVFSIASTEDVRSALDPSQNGFNAAMDPSQNGFNAAMDPSRNGVGRAFDPSRNGFNSAANDVGNYFTEGSRSQQATRGLAVGAAGAAVVGGSVAAGYGVRQALKRRNARRAAARTATRPESVATTPAPQTRHWWNRSSSAEPVMTPVVPEASARVVAPPAVAAATATVRPATQPSSSRQVSQGSYGQPRRQQGRRQ